MVLLLISRRNSVISFEWLFIKCSHRYSVRFCMLHLGHCIAVYDLPPQLTLANNTVVVRFPMKVILKAGLFKQVNTSPFALPGVSNPIYIVITKFITYFKCCNCIPFPGSLLSNLSAIYCSKGCLYLSQP